jgi:DNA helicase-2/ATP-dependent DNA helicase PcrA
MARIICVGDENQALYGFRGADSNAFRSIGEMLSQHGNVTKKELPINYRCDQLIIKNAQQWVPALRGNSNAKGTVETCLFSDAMERVNNNNTDISLPDGVEGAERTLPLKGKDEVSFAFLCRINLPLIITAYQLIGAGKRCCIIGRNQIGAPLKSIIHTICGKDSSETGFTNQISDVCDSDGDIIDKGLMSRLQDYRRIQSSKLATEGHEKKLDNLLQNIECIEVIAERVRDDQVSSVLFEIDNLFVEDRQPGVISLSTIHRSKGLEWDVVFILRPDLLPHPMAKPNPDGSWSSEQQQEQNASYVAGTRARNRLYYVENWPFGTNKTLNFRAFEPLNDNSEKNEEELVHNEIEEVYNQPIDVITEFTDDGEPF